MDSSKSLNECFLRQVTLADIPTIIMIQQNSYKKELHEREVRAFNSHDIFMYYFVIIRVIFRRFSSHWLMLIEMAIFLRSMVAHPLDIFFHIRIIKVFLSCILFCACLTFVSRRNQIVGQGPR